MPPRSYIVTVVFLVALVALSFPLTLGFSIILWNWLFAIVAFVLTVVGVFRIASGIGAPLWIGFALAAPGIVWAVNRLFEMIRFQPTPVNMMTLYVAAFIALLAAGVGALRLMELMSSPRSIFRVGYGVLLVAALVMSISLFARTTELSFTRSMLYITAAQALSVLASLVKYGAFAGAAVLISRRYNIERWTAVAIGLVSAFLFFNAISAMLLASARVRGDGLMFWLQPTIMLIGAAAVWRMGVLLRQPSAAIARPLANSALATPQGMFPQSTASEKELPAECLDARSWMPRGVAIYFGILCALVFLALIPDTITIGMFLFVLPGLILVGSATLLFYSVVALPAYFIDRVFRKRALAAGVATVCLAVAALLPHTISQYLLSRLVASDHSDPLTSFQPRSFELPYPPLGNLWTNPQRPESRNITPPPICMDLCQQLLFKGNVEQVFIREKSTPLSDGAMVIQNAVAFRIKPDGSTERIPPSASASNSIDFFKPKVWRFRLQRLDVCPDTLSLIQNDFVRDVIGGRCLIEDIVDSAEADVVLSVFDSPIQRSDANLRGQGYSPENFQLRRIEKGPTTITLTEHRGGRAVPVETGTTLVAQYAKAPFYMTASRCGGSGIPILCLDVAMESFPSSFADPFEMVGRRYRLSVGPVPGPARSLVPVSEDDRSTISALLNRDYGAKGTIPKTSSRLIASFVDNRLKSGQLNQDDIDLMRVLLKQHAFVESLDTNFRPATYQALKPLLPDMFERIAYRANGQENIVQSLNEMLDRFSAEDTDPYSADLCREPRNGGLRVCYKREFPTRRK